MHTYIHTYIGYTIDEMGDNCLAVGGGEWMFQDCEVFMRICTCIYVCMCMLHICMYVHAQVGSGCFKTVRYVCVYVHAYMYVCACCIYVCMYMHNGGVVVSRL